MNTDIVLGSKKTEPDIVVNGMPLAVYVDQEHTKEIRQFRTEEVNNLSRIKRRNIKCCPPDTSSRNAKTTTKIFQKYEIRREQFMINKEEMKKYDVGDKGGVKVYLIYAAYEWAEICKEMFEMKLFNNDKHAVFNLTSVEIFLQQRYGSLVNNGVTDFSRGTTSSTITTIYKKLVMFGLIERHKESKSVTSGFYYTFDEKFYKMPIQQVLGLVCGKKKNPIKDPNLLCLNEIQFKEKIQAQQSKPYVKDFISPLVGKKLKRIKIKSPIQSELSAAKPTLVESKEAPTTEFIPMEATLHKGVNIDEIIKTHSKYGIPMKELVIYPNGMTRIVYV